MRPGPDTPAPLRVVLATPRAVAGGAQRLLAHVVAPLRDLAIEVHVLVAEDGPLLDWIGPEVASVTVEADRSDGAVDAHLARLAPHVVWAEGASGHCWTGPAAQRAGAPSVWWRSLSVTDRPADRESARIPAAAIACLTTQACRRQRTLTPHTRVVRIPGALPAALAPGSNPIEPTDHAPAWSSPARGPVIGIVSRIDPVKGHGTFLEAAARLAVARPDARFVIVGDAIVGHEGDLPQELRRRAAAPDLRGRVVFTGHVEDPLPLLAGLDVLVSASTEESFGLSVLEAMASGVPVVATRTEGPTELLDDGRAGRLVTIGDPDELARAIAATLDEPDATAATVSRARDRSAGFSATAAARRWAALLRGVVRHESARAGSTAEPDERPGPRAAVRTSLPA